LCGVTRIDEYLTWLPDRKMVGCSCYDCAGKWFYRLKLSGQFLMINLGAGTIQNAVSDTKAEKEQQDGSNANERSPVSS